MFRGMATAPSMSRPPQPMPQQQPMQQAPVDPTHQHLLNMAMQHQQAAHDEEHIPISRAILNYIMNSSRDKQPKPAGVGQ